VAYIAAVARRWQIKGTAVQKEGEAIRWNVQINDPITDANSRGRVNRSLLATLLSVENEKLTQFSSQRWPLIFSSWLSARRRPWIPWNSYINVFKIAIYPPWTFGERGNKLSIVALRLYEIGPDNTRAVSSKTRVSFYLHIHSWWHFKIDMSEIRCCAIRIGPIAEKQSRNILKRNRKIPRLSFPISQSENASLDQESIACRACIGEIGSCDAM